MKNVSLLLVLFMFTSVAAFAQDEESVENKGFDKSKLFFGGNLGASFGDYTFVNLSPQVGYRFTDLFAAGTGINFIYTNIKYRDYNNDLVYREEYGYAGLNIFGRVYPIRQIMLQVQPELNYTWGKIKDYNGAPDVKLENKFVPSLLVGGGAALPAGGGAFTIMLQYDLLQNARGPYGTRPFLSFGYSMGF